MKGRTLFAVVGALLLVVATTAMARAWPNQPPDKVVISGPDIAGPVEVKDEQALALFRLGNLEDFAAFDPRSTATPRVGAGYTIVRFFYGGEFDFARLTYYPNSSGGRGTLYFEDGPMLRGNSTPYDRSWLFAQPAAELKLRALLTQLGAKLDGAVTASGSANASTSTSEAVLPGGAAQASQAPVAQTANPSDPKLFPSAVIPLGVGLLLVLGAAGALWLWRARRLRERRVIHRARS